MTGVSAALCEVLHTMKKISLKAADQKFTEVPVGRQQ